MTSRVRSKIRTSSVAHKGAIWNKAIGVLWFLLFFAITEGFGFRSDSWGGLGSANLGWFGTLQVSIAVLSLVCVVPGIISLYRNRLTPVGFAAFLLGLLPVYFILVSIFRAVLGISEGLNDLFPNVIQLKNFLYIYLFSYLVSLKNGHLRAMWSLAFYSVVTSVSMLAIVATGLDTLVTNVSTSSDVTRSFRVIFPGGLLMAAGWLFYLSRYLAAGGFVDATLSLLCFAATVGQLHRSTLVAAVVAIAVLVCWLIASGKMRSSLQSSAVYSALGLMCVGAVVAFITIEGRALDYVVASSKEVMGLLGNSGLRFNIIANSWNYMIWNTYGFGLGLSWDRNFEFAKYLLTAFHAGPTRDSSYANILVVAGLPGIIVYVSLFVQLWRQSKLIHVKPSFIQYRIFSVFLKPFLAFCIVSGLGTDIVLLSPATAIFMFIVVIASSFEMKTFSKGQIK